MRRAIIVPVAALLATLSSAPGHTLGLSSRLPTSRLLTVVNTVRSRECGGQARRAPPLHEQSRLDAAARLLARGASLSDAATAVGYRALASISVHISGDLSPDAIGRTLAARFCGQLVDPALRDIGFHREGSDLWILAAEPFATPALTDPNAVARRVLELTNAARAVGHRCGRREFGPAPPLRYSAQLARAALEHSRDMAAHSYLSHTGRDGSTPGERISRTGYTWRIAGENIAAGPTSASEVTAGWLASPEHCENLMDPRFTEMAVAYEVDPRSRAGVYWTEEFGTPQRRPTRRQR